MLIRIINYDHVSIVVKSTGGYYVRASNDGTSIVTHNAYSGDQLIDVTGFSWIQVVNICGTTHATILMNRKFSWNEGETGDRNYYSTRMFQGVIFPSTMDI